GQTPTPAVPANRYSRGPPRRAAGSPATAQTLLRRPCRARAASGRTVDCLPSNTRALPEGSGVAMAWRSSLLLDMTARRLVNRRIHEALLVIPREFVRVARIH